MSRKEHPKIVSSKINAASRIQHPLFYTLIVCIAFVFVACSPVLGLPVPATASVVVVSSFTAPPENTATPAPSAVPLATFTPMVTGLGEVVFGEDFDGLEFSGAFASYGSMHFDDGALVMELRAGEPQPPAGSFSHELYGSFNIAPDMTALFRFRIKPNTVFQIGYLVRDGGNGNPVRFDFNSGASRWELYGDGAQLLNAWGAQPPRADVWLYFSIHRSAGGNVDAMLWEEDDPTKVSELHQNLGEEWGTLDLTLFIVSRGSLTLDEYQQLQ